MKYYKHPNFDYVHIVEIPRNELFLIDFAHCLEPTESVDAFYERQTIKPDILINGGFFHTQDGRTVLNYIDDERIWSRELGYAEEGIGIFGKTELVNGNFDELHARGVRDFISGYPVLISNGESAHISYAKEVNYLTRRTVLGYTVDTIYIVVVDEPTMHYATLQLLLLGLGVRYAINLDGGGSTRMLIGGKLVTTPMWARPIDNVVALYLQAPKSTFYRVQLGAFTTKARADALKEQIVRLNDTIFAGYNKAFVTQPMNLGPALPEVYKVQVGAYPARESAMRVASDLKSKGFDVYLVEVKGG